MTNFLVQHNLPLLVADHLSPLVSDIFPDSKVAKGYACARTKTTNVLNGVMAPFCKKRINYCYGKNPYSLALDASSDMGLKKLFPLTVRYLTLQGKLGRNSCIYFKASVFIFVFNFRFAL